MKERTLLNKLALERCEFHLSQLCALAHSFKREKTNLDRLHSGNFYNIIKAMNEDLKILAQGLDINEGHDPCKEPQSGAPLKMMKNKQGG